MRSTLRNRLAAAAGSLVLGLGLGVMPASPLDAVEPAPPAERCVDGACNEQACDNSCKARYGPFAGGYCSDGQCLCAL